MKLLDVLLPRLPHNKLIVTLVTPKNMLLKSVAERVGIFFFYKSDDDYSDLQAPLIKMLEQGEGFSIIPVSMDGKPLPSGLSPITKPMKAMPNNLVS
ncbi:type IV conjugative transfer system protein TraF [Klebsiella pneumoniae]|uniref:Type IV conjugative transfer system protein TraF n=1 Tax=Klebsiella pneumoniae TaxID=573 RepID=A0A2X3ENV7_KLEPN|nr:type IV conjugative transfer system protein TraF [Klebsiella pneumoniae]